jgi:hypothetical protein
MPEINKSKEKDFYTIADIIAVLNKHIADNPTIDSSMYYKPTSDDSVSVDPLLSLIHSNGSNTTILDDGSVTTYGSKVGKANVDPYYKNTRKYSPKTYSYDVTVDTPYKDRSFPADHISKIEDVLHKVYSPPSREEVIIGHTVANALQEGDGIEHIISQLHDEGIDTTLYEQEIKATVKKYRAEQRKINKSLKGMA